MKTYCSLAGAVTVAILACLGPWVPRAAAQIPPQPLCGFPVEVPCLGCPPPAPSESCACSMFGDDQRCAVGATVGGTRGAGVQYGLFAYLPGDENHACRLKRTRGPYACGAVEICATQEYQSYCAPAQQCAFRFHDTCYSQYTFDIVGDCPDDRTCIWTYP